MTQNKKAMYLITPTLLNSWNYIFKVNDDKVDEKMQEFERMLRREKLEPNQAMKDGIEFERKCIEEHVDEITEKIKGGAFQVRGKKEIEIDGQRYLLYGRIDALKEGVIYDIKKNQRYTHGKYYDSYQHHLYMLTIPEAKRFEYLVGVDAKKNDEKEYNVFTEVYDREDIEPLENTIRFFMKWLEQHNLLETYKNYWEAF